MVKRLTMVFLMLGLSAVGNCADVPGAVVLSGSWGNVWKCIPTYKVRQTTALPGVRIPMVNISAARNESEPFQLVLRPSKPLADVKVVAHQLNGPGGAKLAAWNISVRKVEFLSVAQGADQSKDMFPDPLPELTPCTAPKDINSPMWLTVYVPEKTPAGDYTGTIDITAKGGLKLVVPVRLHVWDFSLPSVSKLRTAFGLSFDGPVNYRRATTLEQKRKLVDVYNNDFWRHRVSPIKPYAFYDPKIELTAYKIKVDFSDFDIAVKKYFAMFNSFMLPGFGIGDNLGLDLGTQADRLKVEYMRTVAEHLGDKGQIDKGYANILRSSPVGDDKADAAIDRIRRADPTIKVLVDGQADAKTVAQADIVAVRPSAYDDQAAKKLETKGIETWFTVPTDSTEQFLGNSINASALNARILPWLCWIFGVTGMHYSETTGPSYEGDLGNGRLIYPPTKTPLKEFSAKAPVPSMRWELIREGIEDYDYFRILEDRMQKAKPTDPGVIKGEEALALVSAFASSTTGYTKDPAMLEDVRIIVARAIEGLK